MTSYLHTYSKRIFLIFSASAWLALLRKDKRIKCFLLYKRLKRGGKAQNENEKKKNFANAMSF